MLRHSDYVPPIDSEEVSVWPVLSRGSTAETPVRANVGDRPPFRSAPATPDVPASVGGLLFASYATLIGALALVSIGPGEVRLALVIAGLFVIAFFTVPRILLRQEPRAGNRPSMPQFLKRGMMTYTGHCSGGCALVQMLIVPVLLTAGMLMIALEAAFIF